MTIYDFISEARNRYRSDHIEVAEGYDFNQYETLNLIELYSNSRFSTGQKDSLGRDKPFYNITKFRVNVATRATDLDTKDVQIQSEGVGGYAQSFLLTLYNRNWMKKAQFGVFLNRMTHTRAKTGGVLVKKTEIGSDLDIHVVPWRDVICDQSNIKDGPKIERHYYTPAELKEIGARAGWENIDEAIETAKKSHDTNISGETGPDTDTLGAFIEVFEVHGVLPNACLLDDDETPEEEDLETYSRQMHVIVLDDSGTEDKDEGEGVTLYKGKEAKDPYKYLAWEEVSGRGLGVGVVEDLFESQVWTNYTVKQKKDMLDLASKIIFHTTDGSVAAKNILTDIENGTVVTTKDNTSLTQVNNVPASMPAFSEVLKEWDIQAERVSSTPAAMTGEEMPSGTPFRLAALQNQESGSMFVYRQQEAGLFIQEIYQDWVLPYLVKRIKKEAELVAELTPEELEIVSEAIADYEAAAAIKERILSGELVTPEDLEAARTEEREKSLSSGNRRAFKIPKDFFSEEDFNVDVITTGEQKNKAVVLETLFNIFSVVAKNPQALLDPTLARLFNQIVETAGVSPLMIRPGKVQPQAQLAPAQSTPPEMPTSIAPQQAVLQ